MKAKEIRDLIDFISNTGLEEVNIETEEFKIKVKRSSEVGVHAAPLAYPSAPSVPVVAATAPVQANQVVEKAAPIQSNFIEVRSPMIGTFYNTPKPDAPTFVKVGDVIKPGDVLCIIEAMKLFNEIESEVSGKIVKINIENATPVEYDQVLFLVEPV